MWKKIIDLNVRDSIYFYGARKVIDVHNLPAVDGRDRVRLVTNDGSFILDRDHLIQVEEETK